MLNSCLKNTVLPKYGRWNSGGIETLIVEINSDRRPLNVNHSQLTQLILLGFLLIFTA